MTASRDRRKFKINLSLTRFTKLPPFVSAFASLATRRRPVLKASSPHHRGVIRENEIRAGVGDVKYSISVAQCRNYEISVSELAVSIKEAC